MAKYMLLYRASASAAEQMANATPEQAQAGMEAWMAWANSAGESIVDLGQPLNTAGSVGASVGSTSLPIGGFSIMEADSVDELKKVLDGHPQLMMDGAAIEILELLPIPGS